MLFILWPVLIKIKHQLNNFSFNRMINYIQETKNTFSLLLFLLYNEENKLFYNDIASASATI